MMFSYVTPNLFDRLWQRWQGNPPPEPIDPITQLRSEFAQGIAAERQERAALAARLDEQVKEHAQTQARLERAVNELEQSRTHGREQAQTIRLLSSTVQTLQAASANTTAELVGLTDSNGALREACRRLEVDHKTDQETITLLRERMHTMEADLTALRDDKVRLIGTNQVWQLRAQAYAEQLRTAGLTPVDEGA